MHFRVLVDGKIQAQTLQLIDGIGLGTDSVKNLEKKPSGEDFDTVPKSH